MSLPSYPEYRKTEVEWLGDMPRDWSVSRIKFDANVKARVGWHGLKSDEFTEEGPYLVTGSDFRGKAIDWRNCYHCTEDRYNQDPYIQLSLGDLLITKDGTIGKLMCVTTLPGPATLNSGIFVVRPKHEAFRTEFVYWLLQSFVFHDFIGVRQTGSTINHLYQETFENLPYALPSRWEQTQIARFLDHETAKIDALIEQQQRLIELLKEKRQAVISHAVTKGLDPTVPMKDSGVEWLGEVPAHWAYTKLGRLVFMQEGPGLRHWQFTDHGIRVICVSNITESGIDFNKLEKFISEEEFLSSYRHFTVQAGDILLSSSGNSWGKVAEYSAIDPVILNTSTIRLNELMPVKLRREFLRWFLQSKSCREQLDQAMTGSCQPNFGPTHLNELIAVYPSSAEQLEIAKFLEKETYKLQQLTEFTNSAIELLKERRSALISAAVTGKIDVRNWQPPASNSQQEQQQERAHG